MNLPTLQRLVEELQPLVAGAKCVKIHQPHPALIIFKLWNGRGNLRLLVSAEGRDARLHLTEQSWLNPATPPRFCQLLRARLSRIDTLEILNADRVVRIAGQGRHGDCDLILEATGPSSNMHLLDAHHRLIDSLKRGAGQRNLQPGAPYVLPEKPSSVPDEVFATSLAAASGESLSRAVEKLYTQSAGSAPAQDLGHRLRQCIARRRKKLHKRLQAITAEEAEQEDPQQDRKIGDLLLAQLHRIRPGMTEVTLTDYFADPPGEITVPLDPRLSAQDNAARYFKRHGKARRAGRHHRRRREETALELEWLEQLAYQLEDSVKNSDIEAVAEELRDAGLLRETGRLHERRTQPPSQPRETRSPSGFKVLCGRNNRQNAHLSSRELKQGDLWFHAQDCPGAHVVLKSGSGGRVTDADRRFAAALAAGYSQARQADRVEVMMAEAGAVKRPKGARPGLVTVSRHQTLRVAPERLDE